MNADPALQRRLLLHAARTDLTTFCRLGFRALEPNPIVWNWHLDAIIHALEEVWDGRRSRQIINMPPRTLKSRLVSVLWVAFLLGRNPGLQIMVVSYADPLAQELSNLTRTLMRSDFYRKVFPETELAQSSSTVLKTTRGGQRFATTVGGSVTGFGGDVIILDDPQNASDVDTEAGRLRAPAFMRQSLATRANNPNSLKTILVAQRLHAADLSGVLLEQGGWEHLKLEAIGTEEVIIPIGAGREWWVEEDLPLFPARLSRAFLAQQRAQMGSMAFEAQYQQNPLPLEGNILKRSWLHYGEAPASGDITLSLDCAAKTNPANDYSVMTIWREHEGRHHLLHVWRERVEFPDLQKKVIELIGHWKPKNVLVEDASNGTSLIQALKRAGYPVIARPPVSTKQARLIGVTSYFEAGMVRLPKDGPWIADFVAELLGFPNAKHDDQVDSVSQYLAWVNERGPTIFNYEFM